MVFSHLTVAPLVEHARSRGGKTRILGCDRVVLERVPIDGELEQDFRRDSRRLAGRRVCVAARRSPKGQGEEVLVVVVREIAIVLYFLHMDSEETIPKRRRSRDVEAFAGRRRHRSFILDVVHHVPVPSGGGFDAVVVVFF